MSTMQQSQQTNGEDTTRAKKRMQWQVCKQVENKGLKKTNNEPFHEQVEEEEEKEEEEVLNGTMDGEKKKVK